MEQDQKKKRLMGKLLPLSISIIAILLDQITKALVVQNIPRLTAFSDESSMIPIFGNALRLIHVRNNAVAFSLGHSLPSNIRAILFAFIPLIIIALIYVIYFRNNEFTKVQRWCICGILGGGIGNLIDRFFRPDGVVDFIDCIFWGDWFRKMGYNGKLSILTWDRWPTFNVADMFVVVCGSIFVISAIVLMIREDKKAKESKK